MNTKNLIKSKIAKQAARQKRSRAKISGTASRPRMSVFRSNRHIWVQLIDDLGSKTLAVASDARMKLPAGKTAQVKEEDKGGAALAGKCLTAYEVGKEIARKAQALNIKEAVFDRSGRKYHGRVKGLADGARSEGLKF